MTMIKYRKKSMFLGTSIIAAIALMVFLGFSAISKSGERFSFYTSPETLQQLDPSSGSCLYGSASDLDCKHTSQEACDARSGTWRQGVACNGKQIPGADDQGDDTSTRKTS